MIHVREPAVAGMFYPSSPRQLAEMVREFLREAKTVSGAPKAIIAPHAGYVYSGAIAASAYAQFKPLRGTIERIILLGPSHRVRFHGLALSSAEAFSTPLGEVLLDAAAAEAIRSLPQVTTSDRAHAMEHSLEVQIPFLQEVLGDFRLLPLVVGDATPAEVAEVIERLWGGPETRFVVSSDLSHYYDYATAKRLDRATSDAIVNLRPNDVDDDGACGRVPVRGLLYAASRHGMHARLLDLRNSGDTAGPRDQVVGYGAYAFDEPR